MSECPGTDALTTIASALDWDVENGMRHLNSCAACAEQLRALQITRESYEESAEIGRQDVDRILRTVSAAADRERMRNRRKHAVGNVIEAMLAGGTAVTVLNASGAGAGADALPATLTFVVVALALLSYRVFASSHATASANSSPSIQ